MSSPRLLLVPAAGLLAAAALARAQPPAPTPAGPASTRAGTLESYSTPRSIGIEWHLEGDSDHDAACRVRYRAGGAGEWKEALPLFRVDYHGWYAATRADHPYNMFAGSLLFLEPGTPYEVRLELSDPDGGSTARTLEVRTRPEPRLAGGGRTLHVVPGSGGGAGSAEDPFRGVAAAEAAARPGDLLLLRPGRYGTFRFTRGGAPGRYLAWRGAGGGEAVFDAVEVAASHLWLEGLTLKAAGGRTGLRAQGGPADVVARRCAFTGFHYSVHLTPESRDWHITDNTIVGDNDPATGSISGEGVELSRSDGHVVAHNRISRTADGVSYPRRNCDIYGNDIFDVSDDGLEPDYGYANNRMWGNRITSATNNGLSFQPMYCGPWYFVRNQVIGSNMTFKFRVQDRFLLAHNTFVNWGSIGNRMHHLLTAFSRNNLFISAGGDAPLWAAYDCGDPRYCLPDRYQPDWRTDLDHDGFDWGGARRAFRWENSRFFPDLASFSAAVGVERNGIRVEKEQIFANWDLPPARARVTPRNFLLRAASAAVDAGVPLPGLNDGFAGRAPDLGACEHGGPPPVYGPRE